MMTELSRKVRMTLASVAIACLAMSQTAQSAPTLSITVGSGSTAQTYDSSTGLTLTHNLDGSYSYSSGGYTLGGPSKDPLFSVVITITSTTSPAQSQLYDQTVDARRNGAGGDARDLHITVTDDYIQPVGPNLTLTNTFSNDTSNLNSDQKFLGQVKFGTTTLNNTPITLNESPQVIGFSNPTNAFTLVSMTNLIFNPGETINTKAAVTVNISTGPALATPEPATFALAVSGLGALSLAGLRRRLARKVEATA